MNFCTTLQCDYCNSNLTIELLMQIGNPNLDKQYISCLVCKHQIGPFVLFKNKTRIQIVSAKMNIDSYIVSGDIEMIGLYDKYLDENIYELNPFESIQLEDKKSHTHVENNDGRLYGQRRISLDTD